MSEVSHDQILSRIAVMEEKVSTLEETADFSKDEITKTRIELVEHRAEFKGLSHGLKIGMGGIGFLITIGIGLVALN